jgi:hypothetical protein
MGAPLVTPIEQITTGGDLSPATRKGWRLSSAGKAGPVHLSATIEVWETVGSDPSPKGRAAAHKCGVVFDVTAISEEEFSTARTGFVLLHSLLPTQGRPVQLQRVLDKASHASGSSSPAHTTEQLELSLERFPLLIAGQQPFSNIRSLRYRVDNRASRGSNSSVRIVNCDLKDVEGGTGPFEMEDQRLWTGRQYYRVAMVLAGGCVRAHDDDACTHVLSHSFLMCTHANIH